MFDAPSHWIIVAIVAAILFFGWKQLPDMSRSLGRSLRIFKTEIKGMNEDDKARDEAPKAIESTPAPRVIKPEPVQRATQPVAADRPRPRPAPSKTPGN
jgi:sec-independent protein translocase protein TatA